LFILEVIHRNYRKKVCNNQNAANPDPRAPYITSQGEQYSDFILLITRKAHAPILIAMQIKRKFFIDTVFLVIAADGCSATVLGFILMVS